MAARQLSQSSPFFFSIPDPRISKVVAPPNLERQVSSALEGAASRGLSKISGEHCEMVIGAEEDLQYSDPDDGFESFETNTVVGSPACITLSSSSIYTKHPSRITVPVNHKLK